MSDEKDAPDVIDLEEFKARLCEDCEEDFETFIYGYLDRLNTVIGSIQKAQVDQFKMIENLQTNLMRLAEGKELEILKLDEDEVSDVGSD